MIEIIGFDGSVHYRRPANHPDVIEALTTEGYGLRGPIDEWRAIHDAMEAAGHTIDVQFTVNDESDTVCVFYAGPVGSRFTREDARKWRERYHQKESSNDH